MLKEMEAELFDLEVDQAARRRFKSWKPEAIDLDRINKKLAKR